MSSPSTPTRHHSQSPVISRSKRSKEKQSRRSSAAKLTASSRQLSSSISPARRSDRRRNHENGVASEHRARRSRSRSRNRYRSPPLAFRRGSNLHSSHRRSPSPPPFFGRFFSRSVRRPSVFHMRFRGRSPRIPYHARPDISPPRPVRRSRSRSPRAFHRRSMTRSPQRANRSHSPPIRGRGLFLMRGRFSRRRAILGNFGQPIYHKPDYEVSPDRTATDAPLSMEEIAEDRDVLFHRMMESKRSENLDEYYRLRDLLNEFDRKYPELAFAGKRRRRSSTPSNAEKKGSDVNAEETQKKKKKIDENNDHAGREELEEVDCSEMFNEKNEMANDEDHREGKQEERQSDNKRDVGITIKHEEGDELSKNKDQDESGEPSRDDRNEEDDELDYDDKTADRNSTQRSSKQRQMDNYYEYEEDEMVDFVDDNDDEEGDAAANQDMHKKRGIDNGQQQHRSMNGRKERQKAEVPMQMFRAEFLTSLKKSIHVGLESALAHLATTSSIKQKRKSPRAKQPKKKISKMNGKEETIETGQGKEERPEANPDQKSATPSVPSLLELSLAMLVTQTALPILSNAKLCRDE